MRNLALFAAVFLEIATPAKNVRLTLTDLKSKLKTQTVTIQDPVYRKEKSYDAFALEDVLKLGGLSEKSSGEEIVFTAKDGYAPNTSFSQLQKHKAFLAFQEHGKPLQFEKVAQGKAMVSPAPYYVVWEEGSKLADEVPWPYQLVKIEVVSFEKKFDKMYPHGVNADSPVYRGFVLFKNNCVRCHSINLQGGDIGPELNAPKNVTEYWDKKILLQFIRNASSFRFKDKMPSFEHLKSSEIQEIYDYLEFMKKSKIH